MDPTEYVTLEALLDATGNVTQFCSSTWSVLSSETAVSMYLSSLVLLVFFIAASISLKYLVKWRIKRSLYRTPNRVIFAGQVLLSLSLLLSAETVRNLPFDVFYSFQLYSLSCYLLLASMFLSYDCRHPPSRKVGFFMCYTGVATVNACLYLIYKEVFKGHLSIFFILGFNEFTVGAAFITMNSLKEIFACFQPLKRTA